MVVHLVWMINKSGQLIFTYLACAAAEAEARERSERDGLPPPPPLMGRLCYGDNPMNTASTLYSLYAMTVQISPLPEDILEVRGFDLVEGSENNLHVVEVATGLKFVFLTDANTFSVEGLCNDIYGFYADFVLKNPLYVFDQSGVGQPIKIGIFTERVDQLVRAWNQRR